MSSSATLEHYPVSLVFCILTMLITSFGSSGRLVSGRTLGTPENNRFISVHYITIHRELCRAGVSLKKLKKIAAERKEDVRNDYIERMAQYDPDELGFIDETSKNDKTPARSRGRSKKGHRAVMKQKFVRGRCFTATALLTTEGIAASRVMEGSMTKALYLDFLENNVVCHMLFYE